MSYATWSEPTVTFTEQQDPDGIDIDLLGSSYKWYPGGILQTGTDYVLSGQLNIPGAYFSISKSASGVEGSATLSEGKNIDIVSLGGNDVLLVEIETDEVLCGMSGDEFTTSALCDEPANCQAIVSVLVLCGQSTFDEANFHGIDLSRVTREIATQTNDVLKNSGVLNKRIRVSFHNQPYNIPGGVPTDGSLRPAINQFKDDPVAQQLRDAYKADMVYYIEGYPEMRGNGPDGEAFTIDSSSPNAYAMASLHATNHTYTFSHESGHLWGCSHQTSSRCSKGYKLDQSATNGNQIQTVMHIGEGKIDRDVIPHFSNPKVDYNNDPTGIIGSYECANEVSESMCRFADFRDTKELEVLIAQDDETPCTSGASLQASITFPAVGVPGTTIQTYEWRYSYSPIFSGSNPGTAFGNGPSVFLPRSIHFFKYGSPITVYVQLTVTTTDGVEVSWTEAVELCPLQADELGPDVYMPLTILNNSDFEITVFPNPISSSKETLWMNANKNIEYKIELINTNGRSLSQFMLENSSRAQPIVLPQNLPSGIYYLKAEDNAGSSQTVSLKVSN